MLIFRSRKDARQKCFEIFPNDSAAIYGVPYRESEPKNLFFDNFFNFDLEIQPSKIFQSDSSSLSDELGWFVWIRYFLHLSYLLNHPDELGLSRVKIN